MLLILALAGAVVIFGGSYPVGASSPDPAGIGWILGESMERGVRAGAKGLQPPDLTPAGVREGGSHFKAMCQTCHGGPGVEPDEFASGMNPRPPDLAKAEADWTEAEIFWIAKNGVKMSGMPAFGLTDDDDELWKVAAFVKTLPKVSESDYATIHKAHGHDEGDKEAHSH